ncbi:MAG: hypothetical protein ABIC04_01345 [Nanoarchaeota archaeon]
MDLYLMRVGVSKKYYPNIAHIFAIDHYKPKEMGDDDFSKKLIYFYKFGNHLSQPQQAAGYYGDANE